MNDGFSIDAIGGRKSIQDGSGGGYMAALPDDDAQKKKIDVFDPNASLAGYGQGSVWTMS